MSAKFDYKKCNKCGVCADRCPEDVIVINHDKYPEVKYPYECWYCGACLIDCKAQAIKLELPLFMRLVPEPYKKDNEREIVREY
jgi:NAD-dependent dihydropyrimidine dehydrogenase PreA subunit